jgi:hypothetical protein
MLRGRWVLVYSLLDAWAEVAESRLPLNRELTAKEACTWLRWIKGYTVPVELRGFNSRVAGSVPARLERDWKPTSVSRATSLDHHAPPPPRPPDPIEKTAELLGKAVRMIEFVRFLSLWEKRKADIDTIVRQFYSHKSVDKQRRLTARRHSERTRDKLEAKRCPLRLKISGNVVQLIDTDPVA